MNTQIQLRGKEFDGTDYNYVYGDGTPIQNGNELRAAVAAAYDNYFATNRIQTVLIGPGKYDMNFQPLELINEIRLEGLSSDKNDVEIISATNTSNSGLIGDSNFNVPNTFNDVYTSLTAIGVGFSFDVANRSTDDYLLGQNGVNIVKLSLNDASYTIHPFPSGVNSGGQLFVDKLTTSIYYYAYSPSFGSYVLIKLNQDLTVDPSFNAIAIPNGINRVISDPNTGGVFVSGYFNTINGYSRNRIAKINADGTLDLTFDPGTGFNSQIESLCFDPVANRLFAGGYFNDYNGNSAQFFAVLDGTTAAYTTLSGQTAPFTGPVMSTYIDVANSKLIFSGAFGSYNSIFFNRAIRTDLDGSNPSNLFLNVISGNTVLYRNFMFGKDGYIYALGQNNNYNGTNYAYNSILRIDFNSGALYNVIGISAVLPGTSGELFLSFTNNTGQVFNLMPYNVQSTNFVSINVNTPVFFYQVYIRNLKVNGILVNDTRLNIANTHLDSYVDIDYANSSLYVTGGYWLAASENSFIQSAYTSSGDFTLDSSTMYMSQTNNNLQYNGYYNFNLQNGSTLSSALNYSTRCSVNSITCWDSKMNFCFNGFNNTPYTQSNNIASTINSIDIRNSEVSNCFNDSVIPYLNVRKSIVEYSFAVNGSAGNNQTNYNINWYIYDTQCEYSFIFISGKTSSAFPDAISQVYVSGCNCKSNGFYFDTVVNQVPYQIYFSNVHVYDTQGSSLSLKLRPIDVYYNGPYNWYQGAIFDNCSVTNKYQWDMSSVDALSIIIDSSLTTGANQSFLNVQNLTFNNCHVRFGGGLNNALNISISNDKRGVTLSNINYTNCSVSNRTGAYGSFIKYIESLANININNVQFDSCTVRSADGQTPGFISYIFSTGGYPVYLNSLDFTNCHTSSNYSFLSNLQGSEIYPELINFNDCTSGDSSFMTEFQFYTWVQSQFLNFNNCHAGEYSFISGGIPPYTPYVPSFNFNNCSAKSQSFVRFFNSFCNAYFKNCIAEKYSFGTFWNNGGPWYFNINGSFIHCICGINSLGTEAIGMTGPLTVGSLKLEFCDTTGSISGLLGYTGTYNV